MADLADIDFSGGAWVEIPGVASKKFNFQNKSTFAIQLATTNGTPPVDTYSGGQVLNGLAWTQHTLSFGPAEKLYVRCIAGNSARIYPVEVA